MTCEISFHIMYRNMKRRFTLTQIESYWFARQAILIYPIISESVTWQGSWSFIAISKFFTLRQGPYYFPSELEMVYLSFVDQTVKHEDGNYQMIDCIYK